MEDGNHFVKELENLKMKLLHMAALTQKAVASANRAFLERDEALARQVVEGDREINRIEIQIDSLSLRLPTLKQPMTKDLRFIIGAAKISNELERIADQAVNVAERALFLCRRPPLNPIPALERLMEVTADMLDKAVQSFIEEDPKCAMSIREMDEAADQWTMQVLQTLIENMAQNTPEEEKEMANTRRSFQTIIVSRCLERIGDQSTNIGEHVGFIVTGKNVKHQNSDL